MKQLVIVFALFVFGVAMGDAVEYVEKIKNMIKNAPHFNPITHKRSTYGPVEEALGHLGNGVKYYSETILHVGMTVGEGMLKPFTADLKPATKRMPKKIGKKLKKMWIGVFPQKTV
jgi:hypothetical protein